MVGFVFFAKSPRHISFEQAAALNPQVAGRAQKVALTVNADDETLAVIVSSLQPDLLQLHGAESPERVREIKARFGLRVIKAIGVSEAADLARAQDYEDADWLLFDAKPPKDARHPGGNGLAFDWNLLHLYQGRPQAMVSGGLDPSNVADAIRISGLSGIDVSSGVESAPGVKDIHKIVAFVAHARAAYGTQSKKSAGVK